VRAAEELLTVTRKLKQLWILSEAKEVSVELNKGLEERLQVADVAKELRRILRKEDNGEWRMYRKVEKKEQMSLKLNDCQSIARHWRTRIPGEINIRFTLRAMRVLEYYQH
jgi:predicted aldo/keto reductase-like oxidoreductase